MKFKRIFFIVTSFFIFSLNVFAQEESETTNEDTHFFNTYLEMGYIFENTPLLGNGMLFKGGFEYRPSSKNSYFIRVNYDNYSTTYNIETLYNIPLPIDGGASFSDLIGGIGYRFGADEIRLLALVQVGLKMYDFPGVIEDGNYIIIAAEDRSSMTSRVTLGLEYFMDENFALSVDIFQNETWTNEDYWREKTGAWGFSIGLVGSLF